MPDNPGLPPARIVLVGDYDPAAPAHQAIPLALARAGAAEGVACTWSWLHTTTLRDDVATQLAGYDAVWCVPASPYAHAAGALAAIRDARESGRAFLGTCGGFQHALLEYAAAAWGIAQPAHAETEPDAADPVIAPLACSLVEETGLIRLTPGSRLATIYGTPSATEGYHCRYGLAAGYAQRLEAGPLRAAARDDAGEVRAVELDRHPFFIATLFQPERSALRGRDHPLVRAFVRAAAARRVGPLLSDRPR